MKTLNINKLTILFGLFFVSVFFTTSASAACTLDENGAIPEAILVDSGDSETPVLDTVSANTTDCEIPLTSTN